MVHGRLTKWESHFPIIQVKLRKDEYHLRNSFFFFRKTFGQKPQTNLLLLLFSLKIAARAFFPLLGSGMISSSSVQKHNNTTIQFQNGKKIAITLITLLHPNISLHILPTFIDISYGTDKENSKQSKLLRLVITTFFLMILKNDSVRLYGEIKRWSLFGFKGLKFNLTKRIYKPSNRVFLR